MTIEELSTELEIAREHIRIQRKMLHYIAFVLTGNENADAQLAAEQIKEQNRELSLALATARRNQKGIKGS